MKKHIAVVARGLERTRFKIPFPMRLTRPFPELGYRR